MSWWRGGLRDPERRVGRVPRGPGELQPRDRGTSPPAAPKLPYYTGARVIGTMLVLQGKGHPGRGGLPHHRNRSKHRENANDRGIFAPVVSFGALGVNSYPPARVT